MKTPSVFGSMPSLSTVNADPTWVIQGRVVPPSCAKGETILCIQARHQEWPEEHFHEGHCPIPSDLGVELAMATLIPFQSSYVVRSMNREERLYGWVYTSLARVTTPPDCLACVGMSGMTVVFYVNTLHQLFAHNPACDFCNDPEAEDYESDQLNDVALDAMMEGEGNEKEH